MAVGDVIGTLCSAIRGPGGNCVIAALVSQHVPVSPWARIAADIIIVYMRAPLECERLFPSTCTDFPCNRFLEQRQRCLSACFADSVCVLVSGFRRPDFDPDCVGFVPV